MTTPMIPLSDVEMVFGQIGAMMVEALQTLRDSDGCVSGKSNEKSKKKSPRMCPVKKAKDLKINDAMTGRDGFVWVVAMRPKSGAHYWKKCFLKDYENCIDNINFIEQEDSEVECYEFDEAVEKSEAPKKKSKAQNKAHSEAPKKRGRPKKVESPKEKSEALSKAKKRGRPKKVEAPKEKSEALSKAKKRGRPKKVESPKEKSEAPKEAPKKRGRPKKVKTVEEKSEAPKEKSEAPKEKKAPIPRKCPVHKAKEAGMGASAVGNDGNTWIVAERPNSGFLYWKKSK
jgi:hypothetical protein